MSHPHTPHHPRWHRARMSIFWWVERWPYMRFILRELTSLGVAAYALLTIALVPAMVGEPGRGHWLALVSHPAVIALHAALLVIVCFHAVTWFNLAPRAIVVRLKGKRVPDAVIAGANYGAWLLASALVAFVLLGGGR